MDEFRTNVTSGGRPCRANGGMHKSGAAITSPRSQERTDVLRKSAPVRHCDGRGGIPCTSPLSGALSAPLVAAFLLTLFGSSVAFGQPDDSARAKTESSLEIEELRPDEPVDLTYEMLIRQKNGSDSSVFGKKSIDARQPVSGEKLDDLAPQGKEGESTIPIRGYPTPDQPPSDPKPLYAEASIGLHTTGHLEAGISGKMWPFDYHGVVRYDKSSGFEENGDYRTFDARIGGGYVIGLGYGMFSGGYMGAEAGFNSSSYRLYAIGSSPTRARTSWDVSATGSASVVGIDLRGTGTIRRFSISQRPSIIDETGPPIPSPDAEVESLSETSVEGKLEARNRMLGIGWRGNLDLNVTDASVGALNFGKLGLRGQVDIAFIELGAGGEVAVGHGTDGETVASIVPVAELGLRPLDGLSLTAGLTGGVRQNSVASILGVNRYTAFDSPILPEDERIGYRASLHLEPWRSWGIRVEGSRQTFDRYLTFRQPSNGEFRSQYEAASIDRVTSDGYIRFDDRNDLAAIVRYRYATLEDGSRVPYVPTWDAEMIYTRRLVNIPVEMSGSIRFLSERDGATAELDPVFLVGFEWVYSFGSALDFVLEARNLFGQDYQIWEGYDERGIFVSLGARARF